MLEKLQQGINRRYGSKRGLLRHACARAALLSGNYKVLQGIDFGRVERVVFVCSGNICRSPLADVVARQAGCEATSFGLECATGRPANERMAIHAMKSGYDLRLHRTQSFRDLQLSEADLTVVMEPAQLERVRPLLPKSAQLTLLGLWHDTPRAYIHDPYNAHEDYVERCALFLIEATLGLIKHCPGARRAWKTSTLCVWPESGEASGKSTSPSG